MFIVKSIHLGGKKKNIYQKQLRPVGGKEGEGQIVYSINFREMAVAKTHTHTKK